MKDKIAIVTGGTGALGRKVVEKLADEGIKVYVPAHNLEEFNSIFDNSFDKKRENYILRKIFAFNCNATDETSVTEFVRNVSAQEKGNIDFLINTVGGISGKEDIIDLTAKSLDKMINLNFKSAFYFSREVLKNMKNKSYGRIISIGAMAGLEVTPGRFAYSFSKAGVINLMDTISEEMKEFNIRCNTIIPGIIDTPSNREWGSDEDIKKWVTADEIAKIIYNLISDEFSNVRSSQIKVYGSI
ncbi:MAG TPA: SDR family NAD(P)-dependent oxidoreductase [Ignavibacteria bacterium]|nr:SDR family NAD(P)-dependent oxidoreductase [Ignavibacteria bacterium]